MSQQKSRVLVPREGPIADKTILFRGVLASIPKYGYCALV